MIRIVFFCSCLMVSSSLQTLHPLISCNQPDLDNCRIEFQMIPLSEDIENKLDGNCSEPIIVKRMLAPTGPEWGPEQMGVAEDRGQFIPVLNVSWEIQATASINALQGSQIYIQDEKTNETICLKYLYKLPKPLKPDYTRWTFTLEGLVVQPEHTYFMSVDNIPQPNTDKYRIMKKVAVPGCDDNIIQHSQMCRENGSLWEPLVGTYASLDKIQRKMSILVNFYTSKYSERYDVSLKSTGYLSTVTVFKENQTWLNVTFFLSAQQCAFVITIQPFFKTCQTDCLFTEKPYDYCFYFPPRTLMVRFVIGGVMVGACLVYLLLRTCTSINPTSQAPPSTPHSADNTDTPQCTQREPRRRLLIIYSQDHPLYKNIVLKLCAFLRTKCGTEVILDMLDSARLGMIGRLQWLEWHKRQIEKSSDKILILCSQGVQAKWNAMCTGKRIQLKEDVLSTVGDMLVPALCLMVPEFVKSTTFEKYIVAYFDSVSSENDVPTPFNITVRYKLMIQFEELFFRILGSEKHMKGRVNCIEGLSEVDYHLCPTGRALKRAIDDFHEYQMRNSRWFEEEVIESVESEVDNDETGQSVDDIASEATTIVVSDH